jgi:hypothetical protein
VQRFTSLLLIHFYFGVLAPLTAQPADPVVQAIVDEVAAATLEHFADKKLQTNQLAITLADLADGEKPAQGSIRGQALIYPASVIKLFYLVAAHRWLEDGKIGDTEELRRALRDMIVVSGNEPTHYVVDLLTETTSGPELPAQQVEQWVAKRNAINRFYATLGYTNINANQKPWCEGPYGRERVFVGKNYENRNALTTDATARLMTEIALGRAISPARSKEMLQLLQREPFKRPNSDQQATSYTGAGLPEGSRLWSKAGWTSTARHDAAFVELTSGRRFVLVTFTTGHASNREIIPFVAKAIVERLK